MKIICLNPPFKPEHGKFSRTSRSPAITKAVRSTIRYGSLTLRESWSRIILM